MFFWLRNVSLEVSTFGTNLLKPRFVESANSSPTRNLVGLIVRNKSQHLASHRKARRKRLTAGEYLETRIMFAIDPSPFEQAIMEHLNRMRMAPQGELDIFFESFDPFVARGAEVEGSDGELIQRAIDHFGVDADALQTQWASLTSAPPLAWNEDLTEAAAIHNDFMLQFDAQAHVLPGEDSIALRVENAGYTGIAAENVYAFAESALYGHAGFAIDWGDTPTGIQNPPGHRENILDGSLQEVGIAVLETPDDSTDVGPFLITQDFGMRNDYEAQILGVVWIDGFENGYYEPGEGFGNTVIEIFPDPGVSITGASVSTTSFSAGGYQSPIPAGTYQINATLSPFGTFAVAGVTIGNDNVKVDFELDSANRQAVAVGDTATATGTDPTPIDVADNDVDADGSLNALDASSIVITQTPQHGSVAVNDLGEAVYTADDGFTGDDSFSYRVRDSDGAWSTEAAVAVEVVGGMTGDPPVAVDETLAIVGGATSILDVSSNDSDPDGDLSQVVVISNSDGVATAAGLDISYTPTGDFVGLATVMYQMEDANGNRSATATAEVYVTSPLVPWQNPIDAVDVNPDKTINPLDALLIINALERFVELGDQDLSIPSTVTGLEKAPIPFIDVNGSTVIEPLDVLLVINQLIINNQAAAAPLSSGLPAGDPAAALSSGPAVRGGVDVSMVVDISRSVAQTAHLDSQRTNDAIRQDTVSPRARLDALPVTSRDRYFQLLPRTVLQEGAGITELPDTVLDELAVDASRDRS